MRNRVHYIPRAEAHVSHLASHYPEGLGWAREIRQPAVEGGYACGCGSKREGREGRPLGRPAPGVRREVGK